MQVAISFESLLFLTTAAASYISGEPIPKPVAAKAMEHLRLAESIIDDPVILNESELTARLVAICHGAAKANGWWNDIHTGEPLQKNIGELCALVHSEISEAFEAARKDRMDDHLPHRKGLEVELADAVIRICDMAGGLNLDLSGALMEKLEYNNSRADHKPENRKIEGGKKF